MRELHIAIAIQQWREIAISRKSGHSRAVTVMIVFPPISTKRFKILFGKQTFEVLSSRLQPGCAESAIVDGILSLIDIARGPR